MSWTAAPAATVEAREYERLQNAYADLKRKYDALRKAKVRVVFAGYNEQAAFQHAFMKD